MSEIIRNVVCFFCGTNMLPVVFGTYLHKGKKNTICTDCAFQAVSDFVEYYQRIEKGCKETEKAASPAKNSAA